jgi:hypothetical protein
LSSNKTARISSSNTVRIPSRAFNKEASNSISEGRPLPGVRVQYINIRELDILLAPGGGALHMCWSRI